MQNYQQLVENLKSATKLLNLDARSQLYRDIEVVSNHLINPNFRIAVFGPFNHGKSTLLNALLGKKTLPIDLIPTTGAAITVKYGNTLQTRITFLDGKEMFRSGTDILKEFAILDDNRRMRNDVASVEVFSPHPFLKTGVEFLDLPGTNDREEQNNLVKDKLLSADLVVQLLDARKLMTLEERENLRDWLLDRGIKTVVFVANFLNLLAPEEQKQVQNRLRFVAESFRAQLPSGLSNLYRVDALPALRARLKGDVTAANTSGLVAFEAALQNIATNLKQGGENISSSRIEAIASQIQKNLKVKITPLKTDIKFFDDKNKAKNEIKIKAETLIKKGFDRSISDLRNWFNLKNLRDKYQGDAALELTKNNFSTWESNILKKDFYQLKFDLEKWLEQAYDFFKQQPPESLSIYFPSHPQINLPPPSSISNDTNDPTSVAVGGGIGWFLGGPIGAAVGGSIAYLLNKGLQEGDEKNNPESPTQKLAKICLDAVDQYLIQLSNQGLSILDEYEIKATKVIKFVPLYQDSLEITQKRTELKQWENTLNNLNQELEKTLGISIPPEFKIETEKKTYEQTVNSPREKTHVNPSSSQYTYSFSGKGIKEDVGTFKKSSPKSTPSMNTENLEQIFKNWEIDEEIAQMKSQMHSSGFKNNQTSNRQNNQQNNQTGNHKTQTTKPETDKDKLIRAYGILGLKLNASPSQVKQAYKSLVKKWHPDLFVNKPQQQAQAQKKMRLINEAYDFLTKE
ncbi:MAG: dynamin family protein [Cyanobacteria bacterium P01_D01_bin.50]